MSSEEIRKNFSKNLNYLINREKLTQREVAAALGVSISSISLWVKGKTIPRMDKIDKIAELFGVQRSDLLENGTEEKRGFVPLDFTKLKRIPILGRIAAGVPIYAEQNIEGYTYTDLNGGHEYFGLRIHGDSMDAAGIKDGYVVIVRRQDIVDNGQIAVCLIDGQDATLKRFSQEGNIVTLMPQSTNPEHKPIVFDITKTQVKILGLVVRAEFSLV